MHIHILGIAGTFMAGLAVLAREAGHAVSGSDEHIYPPMSTQLEGRGITLYSSYHIDNFRDVPDLVIIGNALSRGNAMVEYVLERGISYTSGPEWLFREILSNRWVIAVAGTHGKTTTTSMIAWILAYAEMNPGFLISGIPENFEVSARLGQSPFFVIEADEYDTAFFDKRSKFVHYHPRTLVLNNLEFDHADIFDNLDEIKKQFHHVVRTVPGNGLIISPATDSNINDVLSQGCWTERETLSGDWLAKNSEKDGSAFDVFNRSAFQGRVAWSLLGEHNVSNGLAAIAAARNAGIPANISIEALSQFKNVKRRMEVKGVINGATVYDDFAHHPTAIASTINGLRNKVGSERIIAVLEFASYTMKNGVHQEQLSTSLQEADVVLLKQPEKDCDLSGIKNALIFEHVSDIVDKIKSTAKPSDHVLIMSNRSFDGIFEKLV